MFLKIVVRKSFANVTGKHMYWSLFSVMLQIKRDSNTVVFLKVAKFLRTVIFTRHLRWLLLRGDEKYDSMNANLGKFHLL